MNIIILVVIVVLFGFLLALQAMHIWKVEAVVEDLRAENKTLRNTVKQSRGYR